MMRVSQGAREALRYWTPAAGWMLVISTLSGDPFSASNTGRYIDPLLRYLFPGLTPAGFVLAHSIIRKTAHFTEFFILGLLLFSAFRRGRSPWWRLSWSVSATALAASFALLDELHQHWVPTRTGSILDSLIDTSGALTAQLVLYLVFTVRSRR